jgi:hypothetical protein
LTGEEAPVTSSDTAVVEPDGSTWSMGRRANRRRGCAWMLARLMFRLLVTLCLVILLSAVAAWAGAGYLLNRVVQRNLPQGWSGGIGYCGLGWDTVSVRKLWLLAPSGVRMEIDGMAVSGLRWFERGVAHRIGSFLTIHEVDVHGLHLLMEDWEQVEALQKDFEAVPSIARAQADRDSLESSEDGSRLPAQYRMLLGALNIHDARVEISSMALVVGLSMTSEGLEWTERGGRISPGSIRLAAWGPMTQGMGQKAVHAQGLEVALAWKAFDVAWPGPDLEGAGSLARVAYGPYQAHGILFRVRGNPNKIVVEPVELGFEGAAIRGRALLELNRMNAVPAWRVEGRIRGLDLERIVELMEWGDYAEAEGRWDLRLDCAGEGKKLTFIDADGQQRAGARGWLDIRSADQLLDRLPPEQARQIKPVLEKTRQYVIDEGSLRIQHLGDGRPSIQMLLNGPSGRRLVEFRVESVVGEEE